ncbi:hypothetical protein A3J90_03845 [candidate division WOR-1 bacterium RIFOXYC2_FULL_37_10]|uniref:Porin domain-containing protein n=1 Tax=candidate division WOR-1 bacterium RIFOXYB2_FULL_37_13 TaxID=1802579 RepID=A0A1F4STE2_UNCSA|nr:MAG: hypothetical protein A2246_02270 [candidate division WOR-1 bacterium RIFOXYA2_FULL_37_7]OGC23715.1 MAG: hypothetical protein A2310_06835 [candidate division WOR-1 bacterium RIFOXYB2_FULL_37_13]OGC36598.1 MAG: hypothetical protein A3J90_03845 [candidate division WOR-1 bacterium RIFOXYC2_FULL_37_10]
MKRVSLLIFSLIILLGFTSASIAATVDEIKVYLEQLNQKFMQAKADKDFDRIKKVQTLISKTSKELEEAKMEDDFASVDESVQDVKEEMNLAITHLKSQIDSVKKDNNDAKLSSEIHFNWVNTGAGATGFDVTRAYINIKKKLDWNASARITLDVARLSTSVDTQNRNQQLSDYLKYAYVEIPLGISSSIFPNLTGKVGLQHTVWIDWADKMFGMRFIAKSLVDNEGIMSSADFGLGALGKISVSGLPEIEYHTTLINGSGYKSAEVNTSKDFGVRLNSTVYENEKTGNIIIGLFGNIRGIDTNDTDGTSRQVGSMVGLKNNMGTIYGEYVYGTGISGYSIGYRYAFYPRYTLFARLDNYDPNRSVSNDQTDRVFYGIAYKAGDNIDFAIDAQSQTRANATTTALYFHTKVEM